MGVRKGVVEELIEGAGGCAVIDGGLATQLEREGADIVGPLWRAVCLIFNPDLIRQVLNSTFDRQVLRPMLRSPGFVELMRLIEGLLPNGLNKSSLALLCSILTSQVLMELKVLECYTS